MAIYHRRAWLTVAVLLQLLLASQPRLSMGARRGRPSAPAGTAAVQLRSGAKLSPHRIGVALAAAAAAPMWRAAADQMEALPDPPIVAVESLEGATRLHLEYWQADGMTWPNGWFWAPEIFWWAPGHLSYLSGLYILREMELDHAVWRRMGPGDESYISFSKGEGDGEWRYGFSLHDEARSSGGGTTTDVDFDFEAPQWCSAIIMRQRVNPLRRIFARGGKWAARLELQLGRNMEGMPVYRSTTDVGERGDADWWIVSKGGRWHYGASAGGQSFEELCEEGFLDMDGPHAASWSHRSAPHGGKGPEEVMWAPADGGGRVSVVDAATERPR